MYGFTRSNINPGTVLLLFALLNIFGCVLPGKKPGSSVHELGPVQELEPVQAQEAAGPPVVVNGPSEASNANTKNTPNRAVHVRVTLPPTVEVDLPFDYVIEISNLTNEVVTDVVVIDLLPDNLKVESSIPEISELKEGNAKWVLGNLGPKEKRIIHVVGVPVNEGDLNFCTDVKYVLPSVCLSTLAVKPDLKITNAMPSEVSICDTIPLTIVVSNPGTGVAQNVVVKESLSLGLMTLEGKTELVYEIGDLQGGESKTIALDVKADRTGTFKNAAIATGVHGLRADSNTTTTVVRQPLLNITKTGPEKVFLGLNIIYDIEVSNVGNGPAITTVLEDTIPVNTSFVRASDGGSYANGMVKWDLGTLQPQESANVSLTLRSDSIGRERDTAIVEAECAVAAVATVTTGVLGIPAVLLEVIDLEDPTNVGSAMTYVIAVTNQGSAPGTNIKIECVLEGETMKYVSSSGPTLGLAIGNTITFDPLKILAPKEKASWNLKVRAINSGDVRFKVRMNSDQIGRDVEETEATHFYE